MDDVQIKHHKFKRIIMEFIGRQYEAHYHLFYPNLDEEYIANHSLNWTCSNNNPLYLIVYGSVKIMLGVNMYTLVFTEPNMTLKDWISPN